MGKTEDKFFKLLKLVDDCREKLHATYNLYSARLIECKTELKEELSDLYSQLLDVREELLSAKKVVKSRQSKIKSSADDLYASHNKVVDRVEHCMDECNMCKKTYTHEAKLCFDTYKKLDTDDLSIRIKKGFVQQMKFIKAILGKIDIVKNEYLEVKAGIKNESKMFVEEYNKIDKKVVELV